MVPWVALTAASAARGQADKPTTDVAALRISFNREMNTLTLAAAGATGAQC